MRGAAGEPIGARDSRGQSAKVELLTSRPQLDSGGGESRAQRRRPTQRDALVLRCRRVRTLFSPARAEIIYCRLFAPIRKAAHFEQTLIGSGSTFAGSGRIFVNILHSNGLIYWLVRADLRRQPPVATDSSANTLACGRFEGAPASASPQHAEETSRNKTSSDSWRSQLLLGRTTTCSE